MRYFGLSLFLAFGILQAQEVVQSPMPKSTQSSPSSIEQGAMSKPYAEFLFGTQNLGNLNVEILSQKELEETQGEFWNFAKGGVDFVVYFFKKTKENGWWNFRF